MLQLNPGPQFNGVFDLELRRTPTRLPAGEVPGAVDYSIKTKVHCGTNTCADTCKDTCCYTSKYC
jgi:hypothetical protein